MVYNVGKMTFSMV